MRLFQYAPRFLAPKQRGFTIVELLIVIVVIGILAAITIVGFNGVTQSAAGATLMSDLRNAQTQLEVSRSGTGSYPADQDAARNIVDTSDGTLLEYTLGTNTYCVTVSSDAAGTSFYYDKTTNVITEGACPGHTAGGPAPIASISAGSSHTCGIASGQAYCWGSGISLALGNNSSADSLVPVAVSTAGVLSGRTVSSISSGGGHTCALADGLVFCWGQGGNGQLGNNSNASSAVPVAVSTSGVLSGRTVTSISSGVGHTCALADGLVFCWGSGTSGQLGDNNNTNSLIPVAVSTSGVLSGRTVTSLSSGNNNTCAIADGLAFCWGSGTSGQLGNNTNANSPVPVAVSTSGVLSGRTVTNIARPGGSHTCAVADSLAFCWGQGFAGRLGTGGSTSSPIPVAVSTAGVLSGRTVTSLTTGISHTCAVADGLAFCWGEGASGRLGNGATSNSFVPVTVSTADVLNGLTVSNISSGGLGTHNCALAEGRVFCWGAGGNGRLGNNSTITSLVPVTVDPFPGL